MLKMDNSELLNNLPPLCEDTVRKEVDAPESRKTRRTKKEVEEALQKAKILVDNGTSAYKACQILGVPQNSFYQRYPPSKEKVAPHQITLDKLKQVNELRATGMTVKKACAKAGLPESTYYQNSGIPTQKTMAKLNSAQKLINGGGAVSIRNVCERNVLSTALYYVYTDPQKNTGVPAKRSKTGPRITPRTLKSR